MKSTKEFNLVGLLAIVAVLIACQTGEAANTQSRQDLSGKSVQVQSSADCLSQAHVNAADRKKLLLAESSTAGYAINEQYRDNPGKLLIDKVNLMPPEQVKALAIIILEKYLTLNITKSTSSGSSDFYSSIYYGLGVVDGSIDYLRYTKNTSKIRETRARACFDFFALSQYEQFHIDYFNGYDAGNILK